jgi:hypothetical protein
MSQNFVSKEANPVRLNILSGVSLTDLRQWRAARQACLLRSAHLITTHAASAVLEANYTLGDERYWTLAKLDDSCRDPSGGGAHTTAVQLPRPSGAGISTPSRAVAHAAVVSQVLCGVPH